MQIDNPDRGFTFKFDGPLDFHGTLRLKARVSQTMSGWKRWILKPVDPFFAKNGAGTFLRIKVDGTAADPQFGRDTSDSKKKADIATPSPPDRSKK